MKNLPSIILVTIFSVAALDVEGQIRRKQLEGNWKISNEDSLYYRSDSLVFYLDVNHWINTKTCYIITWRILKNRFELISTYLCTEPARQGRSTNKEKLSIKKRDYGQVIELRRMGQTFDQFKIIELEENIIERYPHDVKELTILRFDKITEEKLYKYVDSLVYQVLNYRPGVLDSTSVNITEGTTAASKITIRDSKPQNPKPLLIVNGIPFEHYEILKQFLFVEATSIKYITKEQSSSIYGYRAINGVIVVSISNKKFKEVLKHYGG